MTLKDKYIQVKDAGEVYYKRDDVETAVRELKGKIRNSVAEGSLAIEVFESNVFPLINEVFG